MPTLLLLLILFAAADAPSSAGRNAPDDDVRARSSLPPLVLLEESEPYDVRPHAAVLVDVDGRLTFDDVLSDSVGALFQSHGGRTPKFGYSTAVYWLRFTVHVRDRADWLLEIAQKSLDHVELRTTLPESPILRAGDGMPFYERPIHHRRLLFPLPPDSGGYDVYLRAHSQGPIEFPLRIWSEDALNVESRQEEFALGIFFGILLIMAVYNLVLYASLRDASYLFFALFIASFALYQASVERIAFEYLWPDNLWWMDRANNLLAVFCGAWAVLFTRSFLDTRKYAPALDRMLIGLVGICALFLVFVAVGPSGMINKAVVYFFIALAPAVLGSAIVCVLNRDRAAVYYLLGWTILLVGVLAGMLGYLGIMSEQISGISSVRFGAFTGIVLLSQIGLGARYDQMRREREELRLRIATDLHDEIGSQLTEISLYSELIGRVSDGNVAGWADQMGRQAREMTGKMQDIVWAINPSHEGWDGLELRMKDFSSRLLAPQNISFEMKGDRRHRPDSLSLAIRKNVLLIYKEIVHNAVRHAECSRIVVRYDITRRQIWLQICDDGKGFDPESVRENNGLKNLRYRSREIRAEIALETSNGGPTCYEISVPLTRNHLNE